MPIKSTNSTANDDAQFLPYTEIIDKGTLKGSKIPGTIVLNSDLVFCNYNNHSCYIVIIVPSFRDSPNLPSFLQDYNHPTWSGETKKVFSFSWVVRRI